MRWDLHKKLVAKIGAGGDGARAHGVPAPLLMGLEISSQKERTRRGPHRLLQLETVLGSRSTRFSLPFSPSGQMLSAGLHPVLRHRAGRSPEHFFWGSAQLRGPYRGGEGWKHRGHPGIQTERRGSCLALPFPHGASSPPGPPSSAHVPSEAPVPPSTAPAPSQQHGDGEGETQRGSCSGKTQGGEELFPGAEPPGCCCVPKPQKNPKRTQKSPKRAPKEPQSPQRSQVCTQPWPAPPTPSVHPPTPQSSHPKYEKGARKPCLGSLRNVWGRGCPNPTETEENTPLVLKQGKKSGCGGGEREG